ncbi:unnamed protein product [Larinioides sclopetarius]|uniref:Uncharacterized protein n=1 Tax=Larinioides sclopetarius TaxID=280406 RepID=A0AAV2C0I5_9ARAC
MTNGLKCSYLTVHVQCWEVLPPLTNTVAVRSRFLADVGRLRALSSIHSSRSLLLQEQEKNFLCSIGKRFDSSTSPSKSGMWLIFIPYKWDGFPQYNAGFSSPPYSLGEEW